MKRIVAIGDQHCGHKVGLTPPQFWLMNESNVAYKPQRELWDFYAETMNSLKPIHTIISNGDHIDGRGERSGGRELLTTDRLEQAEMAAITLNYAEAENYILTFGTPYHTGQLEDMERVVFDKVDCPGVKEIHSHAFLNINGLIIDAKHKIGSSGVPHGRYTAVAREKLWNMVWHYRDEQQPAAGLLIRSHVHYCEEVCSPAGKWRAMTLGALQGYGSLYGKRECAGVVDITINVFDIEDDGRYTWTPIVAALPQQTVHVTCL